MNATVLYQMWRLWRIVILAGVQVPLAKASILVTAEAPGVQASTVAGVTTETFDSIAPGVYSTLTTSIGTYSSSVGVVPADLFGGAGGTGSYLGVGVQSGTPTGTLQFAGGPKAYFGFWWSAADPANVIDFYLGSTLLGSFDPASALGALTDPGYFGNPNGGGNATEKYAYLNFVGTAGTTFDRIVFHNNTLSGFESDNHSIFANQIPDDQIPGDEIGEIPTVSGVPELPSWTIWSVASCGAALAAHRQGRLKAGLPHLI